MTHKRTLVGFIDLSLILLGSVALIGELQQSKLVSIVPPSPKRHSSDTDHIEVGIARLFEPDEARLSTQGQSWVRYLARQADGRPITIAVSVGADNEKARLDNWERAAARTASIMYALESEGYPTKQIRPSMPQSKAEKGKIIVTLG
ncbi:MAG: hypothetical protein OSA47_03035 [Novosphingopyxis baekryungensis]|nr:hypothetical protein [Novosphingopyxis baekryungensis]